MKGKIKSLIIVAIVLAIVTFMLMCGNGLYHNRNLFDAVENNDVAAAQKAIERGAWVNTRKHLNTSSIVEIVVFNLTPLETACKIGNQEMVALLLENGADINKGNKHTQSTPLLYALHGTKSNRFSLAMYLIENGADIYNAKQAEFLGHNLIYISKEDDEKTVQEGFELFRYLMENNVALEIRVGSENLLTYAAKYRNYDVVKYLIEEGYFDVNVYDRAQNTALITATKYEHPKIVELLLESGADMSLVDASGKTALDYAYELENQTVIDLLIESTD